MEGSRGRRGKKAGWQVSAGLKDVIFLGVGVVGLMMTSFALGVLAGRGEIYRVFYQWGLLSPNAPRVHWVPTTGSPAAPLAGVAATAPGTAASPAAPVTGSIAPAPASSAASKKSKGSALGKDRKAREEELRRVRREVVRKLKFQNSLDSQPKAAKATPKQKEKAPQVKVGQFRNLKAAKAKVAELQKKGIKATLKEGKDQKGPLYTVYKQVPATPAKTDRVAQRPEKKPPAQPEKR
jgi:hypothetical protein